MLPRQIGTFTRFRPYIEPFLPGGSGLAFLPALALAAYWIGGETALIVVALGLPLLLSALNATRPVGSALPRDAITGLMLRDGFDAAASTTHLSATDDGRKSAIFLLEIDSFADLSERHGREAADLVVQRTGDRIRSALRDQDVVARISDNRFGVCLSAVRHLDLEICITLAGRMQAAIEDPIPVDGMTVYTSCSIGFCILGRAPGDTAADWMAAAADALAEARAQGASTIRAFTVETLRRGRARSDLVEEAASALENGQIQLWYQPQISTDTGKITGFEALARWAHPTRGVLTPDAFLPVLREAGLMDRLSEVVAFQAMTALNRWDQADADVPQVAINLGPDELRNPGLPDRLAWDLDRFNLPPHRLAIEILETVVSTAEDDVISRNIFALGSLGCQIDLDDFGTGATAIAAIRRYGISRIKIDRSFVAKADRDPEQQRLVGAILSLAERLGLETLAEGVETVGEHALLAQLGCGHVQGFGIGRPMPFDRTLEWIETHRSKLEAAPRIGRSAG